MSLFINKDFRSRLGMRKK